MNKYKYRCFYNRQQWGCEADTSYEAQKKAVKYFRPPNSKRHMVHVVLVEKNGKPVTHSTAEFG